AAMGGVEPLGEAVLGELVHQEADRAAVHAIDRLAGIHEPLQGRQHKTVAAERDDDVGSPRAGVAAAGTSLATKATRLKREAIRRFAITGSGFWGSGFKTAAARRRGRS